MKRKMFLLGYFAIIFNVTLYAQSSTHKKGEIEQYAEFPGGKKKLLKFLKDNLHYPDNAVLQNTQGQVFVEFLITETGKVEAVKIKKSLSKECDEEAIRLVKAMPDWKPAIIQGRPTHIYYLIPITFSLDDIIVPR